MKYNDMEKVLGQLSPMEDAAVEEIAEIAPALDKAARDRIEALCERKMRLEDMNATTTNQVYTENVKTITKTQWYRPVIATAACLLLVAGVGGGFMLGSRRPAVTPPVSTDVPTEMTSETTEPNSSEPLINGLSIKEMQSIVDANVKCLNFFSTMETVTFKNEDLGSDTYEVESGDFTSFAELEEFANATFSEEFAASLLYGSVSNCAIYLEQDGKFCIQPRTALDGVCFYEDWSSYSITNPAAPDNNTVVFDVTVYRTFDDNSVVDMTYTFKAFRQSDKWVLEKLYGYDEE